jgi:uncharacterized membrane protein
MREFEEEVEESVTVGAPLRQVYDQWTQFESFPSFMEGVKQVKQLDDKRLFWRAEIGGSEQEWEAEIVDQTPDERIAWRSVTGAVNAGAVLFRKMPDGRTEVTLRIRYNPKSLTESVGSALGLVGRRVAGDLQRFATFMEERGQATGAWRGEIHGQEVKGGSA